MDFDDASLLDEYQEIFKPRQTEPDTETTSDRKTQNIALIAGVIAGSLFLLLVIIGIIASYRHSAYTWVVPY